MLDTCVRVYQTPAALNEYLLLQVINFYIFPNVSNPSGKITRNMYSENSVTRKNVKYRKFINCIKS